MGALFDLPADLPARPKRVLNPYPRVGQTPQWRPCATCAEWVLLALADGGIAQETVDPWTLTPAGIELARLLGRAVFRAPVGVAGRPAQLWWAHPRDVEPEPWKYYWLPEHECGAKPLPGGPLPIDRPVPPPADPPF